MSQRCVISALLCVWVSLWAVELFGQARPFQAIDVRGTLTVLKSAPQRIVSLSPGTTEMLFAIGLKGRIVGVTTYCNYPPDAISIAKIGDVNTSIEKVLSLKPDLIVASFSANRSAVEQLERLHKTVFCIDPKSIAETCLAMTNLGKLTGQTTFASEQIARIQTALKSISLLLKAVNTRPRVLVIVQQEPLMVVGPNNFMDNLIELAAANNVGRITGKAWGTMPIEQVVLLKPDIIVASKQEFGQIKNRPGWSTIPAIRNNRLVESAGDEAVRPGPRLVLALEYFIRQFHPEVTFKHK